MEPIKVEHIYDTPISKVWKAITDKNEMKQWYFDLQEFKPEVGFKFEFMGGTEENQYKHLCEITEARPPQKLTYSWSYAGYPGISYVTFALSEVGSKTHLKLTHKGLETFPRDNEDFARHNFQKGWEHIINNSLKNYLDNKVSK